MNRLVISVLAITVIAIFLCIYTYMKAVPYKFSPDASSVNMIRGAYEGLSFLENEKDREAVCGTNTDSIALNKSLSSWLLRHGRFPNFKGAKTNGVLLLDGWGRPLLIVKMRDLPQEASKDLADLAASNSIAIWSAGENGINEWGNNDDVKGTVP